MSPSYVIFIVNERKFIFYWRIQDIWNSWNDIFIYAITLFHFAPDHSY